MLEFDFTTVTFSSDEFLEKLSASSINWRFHFREIWQKPMVVVYDTAGLFPAELIDLLNHPQLRFVGWPIEGGVADAKSESHKMNSALFFAASYSVSTQNALVLYPDSWYNPNAAGVSWVSRVHDFSICEHSGAKIDAAAIWGKTKAFSVIASSLSKSVIPEESIAAMLYCLKGQCLLKSTPENAGWRRSGSMSELVLDIQGTMGWK